MAITGVALAGGIALPFIAGRTLCEGQDRGFWQTLLRTLLFSIVLASVGTMLAWLAVFIACMLIPGLALALDVRADASNVYERVGMTAVIIAGIFFGLGAAVGLTRRPGRTRAFAVAAHNRLFLKQQGIDPTSASDATHVGPNGERLRMLGADNDAIAFMVVGKRSMRAFVYQDKDGRFQSYSGPQRI
ncbi:hypothetical protein GCM10007908_33810 [Rhizobium albus]|nr:hypothetical protein GCM10007908_33810 [Rhizobium albus]